MKTTAARGAKAKCDKLFSQLVRARDGRCTLCGRTDNLQCAHLVSRRYSATRCVLDNAWTLDAGCHMRLTVEPFEHVVWATQMVGAERYEELRQIALQGIKVDWVEKLAELRAIEKAAA